jgi:hypothetical protein
LGMHEGNRESERVTTLDPPPETVATPSVPVLSAIDVPLTASALYEPRRTLVPGPEPPAASASTSASLKARFHRLIETKRAWRSSAPL